MTVFRNRKTAERSGAENMLRYLFEFRFVRFGYGYTLRKQSPQGGTLHLQSTRFGPLFDATRSGVRKPPKDAPSVQRFSAPMLLSSRVKQSNKKTNLVFGRFAFDRVCTGDRRIAEAIAARGTLPLKAHASARYLTQQGQMMNGHKKAPRTRGVLTYASCPGGLFSGVIRQPCSSNGVRRGIYTWPSGR